MKGNHRVHEPIIECQAPVYRAWRAAGKPGKLDGDVTKDFWKRGEWIEELHDIEGDTLPRPWKHTMIKVLWDEEAIWVAAKLTDDTIWATVEDRDEIIFRPVGVLRGRLVGVARPAHNVLLILGKHSLHPGKGLRLGMGAHMLYRLAVHVLHPAALAGKRLAHPQVIQRIAQIRQLQRTGKLAVIHDSISQFLSP